MPDRGPRPSRRTADTRTHFLATARARSARGAAHAGHHPEKLALTVAVGSACALFPLLGTTSLLCLVVGLVLRLNQPILQLINQALWPVHVPVIFACVRLGEMLYRVPHVSFNLKRMHRLLWDAPARFFHDYGATALYAITIWALLAPLYIALVYFVLRPVFHEIKRIKTEATKPAVQP